MDTHTFKTSTSCKRGLAQRLSATMVALMVMVAAGITRAQANLPLMVTEVMYDPAGEDMIALYGQPRLRNRQWLELYNQSPAPVEIKGGIGEEVWTFVDSTGTHFFAKVPAQGNLVISPGQYIILAGDASVFRQEYPGYAGTVIDVRMELRHDYDFIQIKNERGETIAQALWSYNIGANGNGKTLEFYGRDNVRESMLMGGTPGGPNTAQSPAPVSPSPTPVIPKETITNEPYPQPLSVGKVALNELFPGGDNTPGWVELRNLEPYPITIEGWKVTTLQQTSIIPASTTVGAYGFLAFAAQPSPSGDIIRLYDRDNTLMFEVEYQTPIPEEWSVARFPAGWAFTTNPTKSGDNVFAVPDAPIQSPLITETRHAASPSYPTSTLLSQLVRGKLPVIPAFITAITGTVLFVILKKKLTW